MKRRLPRRSRRRLTGLDALLAEPAPPVSGRLVAYVLVAAVVVAAVTTLVAL